MKRFQHILFVAEDNSDQTSAVNRVITLAENNQAELVVFNVVRPVTPENEKEVLEHELNKLRSMIDLPPEITNVQYKVVFGIRFLEVIKEVLRNNHDLVIKTAENPGFLKRLFGTDDMHLMRKCPCPVWLMKSHENSNYNYILAAVDFDPKQVTETENALNMEILELAASLALSDSASLQIIHAWQPFAETLIFSRSGTSEKNISNYAEQERSLHSNRLSILKDQLCGIMNAKGYSFLSPNVKMTEGDPRVVIARAAEDMRAELVVMGTVGRITIPGFFIGNTAEAILNQISCSVLAVKPPGFQTPVKLD